MGIIKAENLTYVYGEGAPFRKVALDDVNIDIQEGELIGIIGHTGSGKSTLIQHFNGLLKPTSGKVIVDGEELFADKARLRAIRFKVGLVFQYPEYQLFEETVYKDIAFGPKNMGLSDDEIDIRVKQTMKLVGLKPELMNKSPFDLSGGQKRRVAIAGVMAMEPKVLILDEPTAGLDPKERVRIRNFIEKLSKDRIVLLATHIVSDIESIADEVLLMKRGRLLNVSSPAELIKSLPPDIKPVAYYPSLEDVYLYYLGD